MPEICWTNLLFLLPKLRLAQVFNRFGVSMMLLKPGFRKPRAFRKAPLSKAELRLQLSYRSPYAWDKMMLFLKDRAIPQLEWVNDDSYQRLITYGNIRNGLKRLKINRVKSRLSLN